MSSDFEDHCWKDIVPPDVLDIYTHYARKTFVGPAPTLVAIDLYELAYQGVAKPPVVRPRVGRLEPRVNVRPIDARLHCSLPSSHSRTPGRQIGTAGSNLSRKWRIST